MEWLTPSFLLALLNIILIDLVLAGDNAIVIALAARNLPKDKQKGAILWGTVGAVVIRIVATLAVVWLLELPYLLLIGGLVLIWIAYKLLVDQKDHAIELSQDSRTRFARSSSPMRLWLRQRHRSCRRRTRQLLAGHPRTHHKRTDHGMGQHAVH